MRGTIFKVSRFGVGAERPATLALEGAGAKVPLPPRASASRGSPGTGALDGRRPLAASAIRQTPQGPETRPDPSDALLIEGLRATLLSSPEQAPRALALLACRKPARVGESQGD